MEPRPAPGFAQRPARPTAEGKRLAEDAARKHNWKRWGPYLSDRQWGTVREDYSPDGSCWDNLPHDHARSRAYRWGEDGLLGLTDRQCRLCFALALWNGQDPILKERLFGLTGPEGSHGEDVKELYYHLDSTPTHSYLKGLYKYPQEEYPYARLVEENARRGRIGEFELLDTGIFDDDRYFDVFAEYAKASPNDVLIRITVINRGPEEAPLHLLPTLWFRNTWIWGCRHEGCTLKPRIEVTAPDTIVTDHETLGRFVLKIDKNPIDPSPLVTENETNTQRLFGTANYTRYVKDAFHRYLIHGESNAINPASVGTKAALHYPLKIGAGGQATVRLRLFAEDEAPGVPFGKTFDQIFTRRIDEANDFYADRLPGPASSDAGGIARQAYAGLLWNKQFYHYIVKDWIEGDPAMPPPPESRKKGRNQDWTHLYNCDVISMPDKWEFPWYAAWDLAFHVIPIARIDPKFAKDQLVLMLREWYMHPNGQIPAYEFALADVNPPVHAWACWRVYKLTGQRGERDLDFLASTFQKLLLNFTWWVNRKDPEGHHLFAGGFLGLDNIGVFDRSQPLPTGGHLEQADGTAWMAFYCGTMLSMALELAGHDPVYEDMASKFFEHFVHIADAMNTLGGTGLWDEEEGFYYDQIYNDGRSTALKLRSMVGLIPLCAVEVLERRVVDRLPGFRKRMEWFLHYRADLSRHIAYVDRAENGREHYLLAIPSRARLERVLRYMLDEEEFLSPFGIRSLSRAYLKKPYTLRLAGAEHQVRYLPAEADTDLFGGNSNWRGPVWFPINYLLIEALQRYHHFYGDRFTVECPTGSGTLMTLSQVADQIAARLTRLFLADHRGHRPCHGTENRYTADPAFRDLLLFHEYFDGETGRGLGASHQTGWTALVLRCLERRQAAPPGF